MNTSPPKHFRLEEHAYDVQYAIAAQCGAEDYETQIRATALCSIAISLKRIADLMTTSKETE